VLRFPAAAPKVARVRAEVLRAEQAAAQPADRHPVDRRAEAPEPQADLQAARRAVEDSHRSDCRVLAARQDR